MTINCPALSLALLRQSKILWFYDVPRHQISQLATLLTLPLFIRSLERIYGFFDLCTEVGAVEGILVHYLSTVLAVPPQPVLAPCWSGLLKHYTNRVRKPHWIVWGIGGQQEHLALADGDISKLSIVNNF